MIYGTQVRLRAIEKEDLPKFILWLNDPEVRRWLEISVPLSQTDEEAWFEQQQQKSPFERSLAIEIQPDPDQDQWHFVGSCGFINLDWQNRSAEMGIHIGEKRYWGQGFGTRVVELLVHYGFEDLNLHRVWLQVYAPNQRAIRTYQKAGFKVEGQLRQAKYFEGSFVDVMIMSVLKPEWRQNQQG